MKRFAVEPGAAAFGTGAGSAELLGPPLGIGTHIMVLHLADILGQSVIFAEEVVAGVSHRRGDTQALVTAVDDVGKCLIGHL